MKQQIKWWFQSHSCGHSIQSHLSFVEKVSLKQITCHKYKSDIAEIAAHLSGTEARELGYLAVSQAAVSKFMDTLDEDDVAKFKET